MPTIYEVEAAPDGTITVRTKGHKGRSCKDASKWLTDALGRTTESKNTAEFYEAATEKATVKQGR